ncbi:MAG: hypothetical protein Q8L23_00120 [Caulobacter sp.]|nr:hypothetical protein [Caulobacter sp.]
MRLIVGFVVALALIGGSAQAQVISPNDRPPPGAGGDGPAVFREPDGQIFEAVEGGGARHKLTGFICPLEIESFTRSKLAVFDRSEGGRDVACGYQRDGSWFTLYLTRLPGMSGEAVFRTYVRQAEDAAPPKGEATAPLAPGVPPLPGFSRFWINASDQVDGLWMSQIGDWHIKLRVTYEVQDEAAVKAFAEELYRQLHDQVAAPEI